MGRLHRWTRRLVWLAMLLAIALVLFALGRSRPQDLPWTPLDLDQPIGLFTGRKLAGLTGNAAHCRALLDKAGVDYVVMKPGGAGQCAYSDAVRLRAAKGALSFAPAGVAPACPVVAALKLWEWQVVQPAAHRIFGQPVRTVTHFGSYSCRRIYGRSQVVEQQLVGHPRYSCRRIYGRSQGDYSEHATADAIDISGFVLADGHRVTVVGDWEGKGKDARFLKAVRDGACGLFSTVLSPDYNAAHRDHLHLDQAERGERGWRACR